MKIPNNIELPKEIDEVNKLIQQGTHQMYQGSFRIAISTFSEVLKLHPNSFFAYQYRAICRHHLLMNTNNISGESRANAMEDIISDLEEALSIANNYRNFFLSN